MRTVKALSFRALARKPFVVELTDLDWHIKIGAANNKHTLTINGLPYDQMKQWEEECPYKESVYRSTIVRDWSENVKKTTATVFIEKEVMTIEASHDVESKLTKFMGFVNTGLVDLNEVTCAEPFRIKKGGKDYTLSFASVDIENEEFKFAINGVPLEEYPYLSPTRDLKVK